MLRYSGAGLVLVVLCMTLLCRAEKPWLSWRHPSTGFSLALPLMMIAKIGWTEIVPSVPDQ